MYTHDGADGQSLDDWLTAAARMAEKSKPAYNAYPQLLRAHLGEKCVLQSKLYGKCNICLQTSVLRSCWLRIWPANKQIEQVPMCTSFEILCIKRLLKLLRN